jgi:hypothetical protein
VKAKSALETRADLAITDAVERRLVRFIESSLNQSWRHPGARACDFSLRWNSSDVIGCRVKEFQPRVN